MFCAAGAAAFLRFRHNHIAGCRDQFVQPGENRTIVTYSCAAQGWGRTELRRETSNLYHLDTQGIRDGKPFALRAEIRRVGNCPGTVPNRSHH